MKNESQSWSDCPAGELKQMVSRSNRSRLMKTVTQWSAVAALLLVGLFAVTVAGNQYMTYRLGPLSCSHVLAIMDDYHAGDLDAETIQNVDYHLDHCPGCAIKYEKRLAAEDRYRSMTNDVAFAFR
ncbi:MAG: zf-HC2 domain-containing protein [bacterium]|nr:zf-HC2 domain-containing protein [bacterium]